MAAGRGLSSGKLGSHRYDSHFLPDDRLFIEFGAENSGLEIWDLQGKRIISFPDDDFSLRGPIFSADGTLFVTWARDESDIALWDLNGILMNRFVGHQAVVREAHFSPSGRWLISSDVDGVTKLWPLHRTLKEKLALARERVGRGFTEAERGRFFRDDPTICPQTAEEIFALFAPHPTYP